MTNHDFTQIHRRSHHYWRNLNQTMSQFYCSSDLRGHDGRSQLRSLPWWGKLRIQTSGDTRMLSWKVFFEDGWMDERMVSSPFISLQPFIKFKSLDMFWFLIESRLKQPQASKVAICWKHDPGNRRQCQWSILLSQLVVSLCLVTLRSVSSQGPDMSSMVSMPRCLRFQRWLVKAWSIRSTGSYDDHTGSSEGLDPLGDPKECESSTDWHSQYVPRKNGNHDTMIQKEIIVCQTCFRDAAFSLGLFLWSFIF